MDNLGMKMMRTSSDPTHTTFISDSGMHMMIELFHNADYPLFEPAKIHFTSFHLAFVTPDIKKTLSQLITVGATIADSLRKTASGDQVLVLRDPWGLAIQFAQRVKSMLNFTGLFIEHLAINVDDSRAKTKWYKDNLRMAIIREGAAPSYGMFIADAGKNMMYELYQNTDVPIIDFSAVSHMAFHVAYMVEDVKVIKHALVATGSKVSEDIKTTPSGDVILMLRDPWGQPVQFVKRSNPMLK
jgi:uncharacterized glyoxalase superfamily protein PhnB